jgi:hypothetical protein
MADKIGRNLEQDHVTGNVSHAAKYNNKVNVACKWRTRNVETRKGKRVATLFNGAIKKECGLFV